MLLFSEILTSKELLMSSWQPTLEKCGILKSSQVVGKPNLSSLPEDNFQFSPGDLDGADASWHTHPSGFGNLSIADYWFFKSWPSMVHFIISETEVRCYGIVDDEVRNIDDQADFSAWLLGRPA